MNADKVYEEEHDDSFESNEPLKLNKHIPFNGDTIN